MLTGYAFLACLLKALPLTFSKKLLFQQEGTEMYWYLHHKASYPVPDYGGDWWGLVLVQVGNVPT